MPKASSLTACVALIATVFFTGNAVDAAPVKKVYLKEPPPKESDLGFQGITRGELLRTLKRVGLMRAALPADMGERPDAQRAIHEALSRQLASAGMEAIPATLYDQRLAELEREAGGFYDPGTGQLRAQVRQIAQETARRDFAQRANLDGFVIPAVVITAAELSGRDSRWDNVEERSAGPGDAALTGAWGGWRGGVSLGSLGAISLQLQVLAADGRKVFARRGGIQLTLYLARNAGSPEFAVVPSNDLLRDPTRIDRAARVVTMPLRYSPIDIARSGSDPDIDATKIDPQSLAAPPPAAASAETVASPLAVPRDEILKSVRRVALSSLSSNDINVPGWLDGRIGPPVKAELARIGWQVVDAPDARDLLAAAKPFDPFTGRLDQARARAIGRAVLHQLPGTPPPDAMLWVSLERRNAVHRDGIVQWDGVAQNGFSLGPEKTSSWSIFARPNDDRFTRSTIAALSIVVTLVDADGRTLYQSAGGLHLLQRLRSRGSWIENTNLSSDQVFRSPARDAAAVHAALRDLVLTPEGLAAEVAESPGVPR